MTIWKEGSGRKRIESISHPLMALLQLLLSSTSGGQFRPPAPAAVGPACRCVDHWRCRTGDTKLQPQGGGEQGAAEEVAAFFLCPEMEKVVRPPGGLVDPNHPQAYSDFTWSALLEFTQKHYRANIKTFNAFSQWIQGPLAA